jgi:peptidyl-prolyl cis-trans isomerase D
VETKLGFHIIQATDVRTARGKSLEEMRGEIESELKKQAVGRSFAELAEKFNNTVYEQSETLKPAAELVKAAPKQSGWITRARADDPLLNNPKLLQAVFSADVLQNRRNTEAIEAAPGLLISARVIEHKPAAFRPFAEVQSAIEKKLVLREAERLAAQEGKARLELLRQGKPAPLAWSAPQLVSRSSPQGLPEAVVRQAFKIDAATLPAYAGVEGAPAGYTLVRVTRVVDAQEVSPEKRQEFTEALRRLIGQEEMMAYVASLKQKAGVKVIQEQLDKKEEFSSVPLPNDRPAPRRRGAP